MPETTYIWNMPDFEYNSSESLSYNGNTITFPAVQSGGDGHAFRFRPEGGWHANETDLGIVPSTVIFEFECSDVNQSFGFYGCVYASNDELGTMDIIDSTGNWTWNEAGWAGGRCRGAGSARIRFNITSITPNVDDLIFYPMANNGTSSLSAHAIATFNAFTYDGTPIVKENKTIVTISPPDSATYTMATQYEPILQVWYDRITLTYTSDYKIGGWTLTDPTGEIIPTPEVGDYHTLMVTRTQEGVYYLQINFASTVNPYDEEQTTSDTPDTTHPTDYISQYASGFYKIFVPSQSQISALIGHFYDQTFIDTLKNLWSRVLNVDELIIGCKIVPCSPAIAGTTNVKVGWVDTGISMSYTSSQYVNVSLGSISIGRVWNSYLDFSPYTKISITLPFIGERELSTNDVMGKTISLSYNIDLLSGECIAMISVAGDVHYQFAGNCAYTIPISSADVSNLMLQPIKAIAGIGLAVGGAATGNPMLMAAGATLGTSIGTDETGEVNSISTATPENITPSVRKIDNLSGNSGYMSVLRPYVCIERVIPNINSGFGHSIGYQSNKYKLLRDCAGYTQVADAHLVNIPCTTDELTKIETLLKGGVIL